MLFDPPRRIPTWFDVAMTLRSFAMFQGRCYRNKMIFIFSKSKVTA
jgi:hypothetical protein